jgi:hypothetical protein
MNVFVLAGKNNIVVSGTDPNDDTVRVLIQLASDNTTVDDESAQVPGGDPESRNFPVPAGTYNVTVFFNNGSSASTFNGVVVPPGNGKDFAANTPEGKAILKSGAPAGKYQRHSLPPA